ncbi:hypothetical protein JCM10369A_43280 [Nocardioides pyridinolyticus]
MSHNLPLDLESRCQAILDAEAQGVPLTKADYAWFAFATILIPAIMIVVGVTR